MAGRHPHTDKPPSGSPGPHPGLSIDPLCKMLVDENDPPGGDRGPQGQALLLLQRRVPRGLCRRPGRDAPVALSPGNVPTAGARKAGTS